MTDQPSKSIPTVSVILSVRNGEIYLREAIESILNQSFEDFELIIVDNHSTDSSAEIVESYDDARIILTGRMSHCTWLRPSIMRLPWRGVSMLREWMRMTFPIRRGSKSRCSICVSIRGRHFGLTDPAD